MASSSLTSCATTNGKRRTVGEAKTGTAIEIEAVTEIVLALNATVDGQTTAHYLAAYPSSVAPLTDRLASKVLSGGPRS